MAKEARPNPESFRRPESVLVVVHTADEVLLLRRADASEAWQSVTGSMQWEEQNPEETARRELLEETGLSAGANLRNWQQKNRYPIHPLWKHRYQKDQTHNLEHVFSLALDEPVDVILDPDEHSRYCWKSFSDALQWVRFETNRKVIQTLMAAT